MSERNSRETTADSEGVEEFLGLLEIAAKVLVKSSDAPAFLDWIADAGPTLASGFASGIDPRTGPLGNAFRAMGVAI